MNEVYNDGQTVIHDDRKTVNIYEAIFLLEEGKTIHVEEPFYLDEDGKPVIDPGYDLCLTDIDEPKRNRFDMYEMLSGNNFYVV